MKYVVVQMITVDSVVHGSKSEYENYYVVLYTLQSFAVYYSRVTFLQMPDVEGGEMDEERGPDVVDRSSRYNAVDPR